MRRAGAAVLPANAGRRGWLLAWLVFLPVAVLRAGTLSESDTFWEIRTGLLTIARHSVPTTDPFSWTMHGQPWTVNSWGFNVVIAAAYRVAGLPGVACACATLVMAIAAAALLLARSLGAPPQVAGALLALSSPLIVGWLAARPQLVDYLALLLLVMLLRRIVAGRDRVRSVLAVAAVSIVWVNMHSAALLGVAVAGACALLLLARRGTRTAGWWCGGAAVAAQAGALLNPLGVGLLAQTARVQSASVGVVKEWQPFDPASPLQWLVIVAGVAAVVAAVRRADVVLVAALLVTAAGSVAAMRLQPFLALLATPVLAAAAAHPLVLRYLRSRRAMLGWTSAAGVSVMVMLAALSAAHLGRPNPADYPAGVVADIPSGCRLFNSYLIGGFVILERPDVPVSLDSRNDLYGTRRVLADERVLAGKGDLARELAHAGCVLAPPASGLVKKLYQDPRWRVTASGAAATLFTRR